MTHRILVAALVLLAAAPPVSAQTANTPAPLDALLNRASAVSAGTYIVRGTAVEPSESRLAVMVQADVLRGTERDARQVRVPIAIGTDVAHAADVKVRIVTTGTATPRVVGEAAGAGGPGEVRLVQDFVLTPGAYEVHAVIGHREEGQYVAALAKRTLRVPDVWTTPFAVTPVAIGDGVLASDRPGAHPFTYGTTILRPAVTPRFGQQREIDVAFRVFNWTADPAEKSEEAHPDLTVEYAFLQRQGDRQVFFNKVEPQRLTAETLGRSFDPRTGMVAAGMRIPLVAFPYGDFDLRVRVTDNRSRQTEEQRVAFTVAP
jgi:hypothetical protein